jgi:hypothetical protein
MNKAKYWIEKLGLQKHPEGGWFMEVYRSSEIIHQTALYSGFSGDRNCCTSIYFLLQGADFSAFHRIKSDEIWHYYTGSSSVEIMTIVNGDIQKSKLGNNYEEEERFQIVVPKNTWFAARLINETGFALVGCTVAPGFNN